MNVEVAKTAGFCFGVERAVRMAESEAEKGTPVYTWGPIVHNDGVIAELEAKGVHAVGGSDSDTEIPDGPVIIRAHGVGRETEERLKKAAVSLSDATCPFVKKIHRIVEEASASGRTVVVFGDASHPEVAGIMGRCSGPVYAVDSFEAFSALRIPRETPLTVVAQTTSKRKNFDFFLEKLEVMRYNVTIADTICNATEERQNEARDLSERSDVMIVIGSPRSSNSRKLFEICNEKCNHTYFIQSVDDLKRDLFNGVKSVGITAGASTPKKTIEEVQTYVRKF